MKTFAVMFCSMALIVATATPLKAEIQPTSAAEVFRLEPIDPFASENKNPVIVKYPDSVWVTSFVPGLGQNFIGRTPERLAIYWGGWFWLSPLAVGAGYLFGSALPPPVPDPNGGFLSGLNLQPLGFAVWGGMLLPLAVYVWNLIDAYQLNIDKNKALERAQSLSLGPEGQLIWKVSAF
jgi:hypothetical protein